MSGNAAKEISDMLNGSIQKVEGIVNDTKVKVERLISEGKTKVETGTVVAKQCGEILEEVVRNVGEVNTMISEISTASHEQAQGVSEITKAMNQMDQVTHQNAATSQEAASSSEELSAQSESLLRVVRTLEETIRGAGDGTKTASHYRDETPHAEGGKKASSKVVSLNSMRKVETRGSTPSKFKQAADSDLVPSENDPRFKEV
jgi:methyl-accepting chemotaxis protein